MLDVLYNDSNIVAISKPSGLLVHPSNVAPDRETCLSLLRSQLGAWIYPVHRLDRGTSGVLIFGLNSATAHQLAELLRLREVKKRYLVVVRGYAPEHGDIDSPLADDNGIKSIQARTLYSRLATVELPHPVGKYETARYSLVRAEPITGRTHQIRRHMAHIKHPVVGDTTYGEGRQNRLFREQFNSHRMMLHARTLILPHPSGSGDLRIDAPLPEELQGLFQQFGWDTVALDD